MTAPALPVVTIGGYLGAGKTTLVNHLLRNAQGRRLAILVNEFGALPIDEDLIEAQDDALISIAGGCICCSFGDDLIGALAEMKQIQPPPDWVVIESSGVALPGAIMSSLSLLDGVRPDGIIVVVDAETVQAMARDDYLGDTILRQLASAEIVVLNKLDLVPDTQAVTRWLSEVAPGAIQIPATHARVPPDALLGALETPALGQPGPHSDAMFESHVICPEPADITSFARTLATGDHGIIRAKGHIRDKAGALWLVQTVGLRWQVDPAAQAVTVGLVVIGFRDRMHINTLAA